MHMRINWSVFALCLGYLWMPLAAIHAEPLLKVDFGLSGGALVQPGFTGVTGAITESTHIETVGPYSVSLNERSDDPINHPQAGFYSTGGSAGNIPAGVRNLFRDYYYNNSPDTGFGIELSLGGFAANHQYDVTVWSYDADNGGAFGTSTPTLWAPDGANTTGTSGSITNFATPYPATLNDSSTTLQLSSTTGTLDLFGTPTGGFGGTRLNGVRVKDGATTLLALDFGRPGAPSSPVQATYAELSGEVSQTAFSQTVGAYNVSLEGQGFYNTTSSNLDPVDPSVRDFYRDYYYNNATAPGEGIKLTVDGVTPDTDYDLTLWSYDADNFSTTPTTWTPSGASSGPVGNVTNVRTPAPATLADNRTTIRVRSTTTSLQVSGSTTGGTGGTRLNGFELSLASLGVDGDYNDNGAVDANDYVIWRKNAGTTNTLPHDPTGGTIGAQQYNTWRAHFGQTAAGGGSSISGSAVPEPASLLMVLISILFAVSPASGRRR